MIFISHSTKDDDFVTRLHIALQRRGYSTWVDHIRNIPAGVRWDDALDTALRDCSVMILVLSNAALNSQVVGAEWRQFFRDGKPIIPVRIEHCVPPLLIRELQYLDFISDTIVLNRVDILTTALPSQERNGSGKVTKRKPEDVSLDIVEIARFKDMAAKMNARVQERLRHDQIALMFPESKKVLSVQLKPLLSVGLMDKVSKPDINLHHHEAQKCGVSRLHAAFNWTNDGLKITDLDSANGTYLDGNRLPPEKPVLVSNKNILQLAQLTIILFLKEEGG
jgi:hypothetical protein